MLKLTRRANADEEIYILDKDGNAVCKFCLIGIRGNQVSIGFTAPKEINILRGEIMQGGVRETHDAKLLNLIDNDKER